MTTDHPTTTEVLYTPGQSFLAVGPTALVATSDLQLVRRLWPQVRGGQGFASILDTVVATGLTRLPDLVLLGYGADGPRVLLRGPHVLVVEHEDDNTTCLDGTSVTTWVERALAAVRTATVGTPTSEVLPMSLGVVRSGAFTWRAPGTPGMTQTLGASAAPAAVADRGVAAGSNPALIGAVPPMTKPPAPPGADSAAAASARPAAPVGGAGTPFAPPPPTDADLASSASAAAAVPPPPPTAADLAGTSRPPMDLTSTRPPEPDALDVSVPGATPVVRDPFEETTAAEALAELERANPQMITGVPILVGGEIPAPADHTVASDSIQELLAGVDRRRLERPAVPAVLLRVSTGQEVTTDRPVVFGRRPSAERVSGSEVPQLVTVPSPTMDISRSHLQVRSGETGVVVTDLNSTNGSVVRRGDGSVEVVDGGRSVEAQVGDVLDLGDGVTVTLVATR